MARSRASSSASRPCVAETSRDMRFQTAVGVNCQKIAAVLSS
jgi:hypothetical protein